jgi:metal-responsive CopG/Arc/MetJ family transcriptional regulator
MVRTQIYLTEEERSALKQLAEERDTSQSALIRAAVDQYLEEHSHERRLSNLRAVRGLWGDRENLHEAFRRIRGTWDRDVKTRESTSR